MYIKDYLTEKIYVIVGLCPGASITSRNMIFNKNE